MAFPSWPDSGPTSSSASCSSCGRPRACSGGRWSRPRTASRSSSTRVRPRRTAGPASITSSPGRSRISSAASTRCRGGGHPDRGLGHARPAGRDRGREGARAQREEGHRGVRRREFNAPAGRACSSTSPTGSAVRPHRLLAGLRASVHHLQQRVHRDGLVAAAPPAREATCCTGATGCCRTARAAARCCRAMSSRSATRRSRTSRSTSRFRWRRDRRRELLVWTTTPWTLLSQRRGGRAPGPRVRRVQRGRPRAASSPRPAPGRCRAAPPRAPDCRARSGAHVSGQRAGRAALPSAARGGPAAAEDRPAGWSCSGDFVTAEDGSGLVHMAPAFGADDYAAGQRARAGAGPAGRRRRDVPRHDLARDRGQAGHRTRDQRPDHPPAQGRDGRWHLRHRTSTLPALLALHEQADLLRARQLVRADIGREGADARAQPAGQLASARGRRRAGSASGWRTTWTGRSRGTATGARRCRCGSAIATRRTWT